jgi:enamine deaminase RidA (YjgF/YER057c/UK114 family)
MPMHVVTRQAPGPALVFITAAGQPGLPDAHQARELFGRIAAALLQSHAAILQERVFVGRRDLRGFREARAAAYREFIDLVEPTWLSLPDGSPPGVEVFAVRADHRPAPLCAGNLRGRILDLPGCRWLALNGVSAPAAGDGAAQVWASLEQAECWAKQAGADFRAVARTWMFMHGIHGWYNSFNAVRNEFFTRRGLLPSVHGNGDSRVPASTGIGVSPADGSRCAIDLLALTGPEASVQCFPAAGNQNPACDYGSAFARAALARSPAGQILFVSGTAAIDARGATCHVGDVAGQIRMTLDNVHAVLRQFDVRAADVVQATAYCANPEVRDTFVQRWVGEVRWPWLVVPGDICRPDLLFEVEATACPGGHSVQVDEETGSCC